MQPPALSCFDMECFCDVSQRNFFMTAYLIDLSNKTVCVCVCPCVCLCGDVSMCRFMWKCGITCDLTDEETPGDSEQWDINWETAHSVSAGGGEMPLKTQRRYFSEVPVMNPVAHRPKSPWLQCKYQFKVKSCWRIIEVYGSLSIVFIVLVIHLVS